MQHPPCRQGEKGVILSNPHLLIQQRGSTASSSVVVALLSLPFELLIVTLFLTILLSFTICSKFVISPYLNCVIFLSFSLKGEKGVPEQIHPSGDAALCFPFC